MKLSIHTVAKDAIRLDFHLEHMIRHHLPFADEIVIMEGMSNDDTFARISKIHSKVKVIRKEWNATESYRDFVELGRRHCTGDWCIKLDADEFLPEWEWARLRDHLSKTSSTLIPIRLVNFYGNYSVVHTNHAAISWPEYKWCIHPNQDHFEFWGDASNARQKGHPETYGRDPLSFEVHHFGAVRDPRRLREKWRTQAIRNQKHTGYYKDRKRIKKLPKWIFNLFPHRWIDPEILQHLEVYDGPLMEVVKNSPEEFTRDNFQVLKYLKRENRR